MNIKQVDLFGKDVILPANSKPFLKWAGGKGQLLEEIDFRLPDNIKKTKLITNYIEPFIGGGAVFFHLKNNYKVKKATLIDFNKELVIGYEVIKRNPKELIDKLLKLEEHYLKRNEDDRKAFFFG